MRQLNEFLNQCEELKDKDTERLQYVVRFMQQNTLETVIHSCLKEGDEFEKKCKYLYFYVHPDRYPTATLEQKKLLAEFFEIITRAKLEISRIKQDKEDFEQYQTVVASVREIGNISYGSDHFQIMKKLEHDLHISLGAYGKILSNQTHRSLVHTYGKVLQYLILWGAEHQPEWLASNIANFGKHCQLIIPDIERAGAVEAFQSALQINLEINSDAEAWLGHIVGKEILKNEERIASDTASRKVDAVTAAAGVGLAALTLLTGPLGWGTCAIILCATAASSAGQYAVDNKRKEVRNEDREIFYKNIYQSIIKDAENVFAAIKREVGYFQHCQSSIEKTQEILQQLDQELEEQRILLLSKEQKTEEEILLLSYLEKDYEARIKEKSQLSKEEQEKLEEFFGIDSGKMTEKEARSAIQELEELDSEDLEIIRNLREESRRQCLAGSERRLMLTSSSHLFGSTNPASRKQKRNITPEEDVDEKDQQSIENS